MGLPALKNDRIYTYSDYRLWPEDERWELINGTAWNMSPAPSRYHQEYCGELFFQIANYLKSCKVPCRVYSAPFDVLLPDEPDQDEDDIRTVVQPDISVICSREKLTEKGCTGAPDWIIEILSPYTSRKDMVVKHALYEKHGVREYWVVDGGNKYVHVYLLGEERKYPKVPEIYVDDTRVYSTVIKGLSVDLSAVFKESAV